MAKNTTSPLTELQEPAAAAVQEQAAPEETISGKTAVVAAQYGLNLRKGPAFSYKVLQELPDGTELTVLELPCGASVPGWALVHTGRQIGWVFAQHLRKEG